jgi:sec-independent protein translocase protein TatA
MIGFDIGGPEAIIVLVIVLVLFGGSQIPKLARNLGRAQKEFKDGIDEGQRSVSNVTDTTTSNTPTTTTTSNTPSTTTTTTSPDSSGQPSN